MRASANNISAQVGYTNLGVRINFKRSDARVKCRHLRNVVVLSLTFFLLQFKRDTADRALLDTLHQVSCEACDLVAQAF
jgi:hypothetical protein